MDIAERGAVIAAQIAERCGVRPKIGAVLGSGWNAVSEALEGKEEIAYGSLDGMPVCGVSGHAGKFAFGRLGGKDAVVLEGRIHLYEGRGIEEVVLPVEVLYRLGIGMLLLTNAAGGVEEGYRPGDVMILRDHINLTGCNPLEGVKERGSPAFIDMGEAYDVQMRRLLCSAAEEAGLRVHEGVYAQMRGPSYETPAEVKMLRAMGADAVGMSTALETIYARYRGMRVAAVSCISNMAAGIGQTVLDHQDVLSVSERGRAKLSAMLAEFFRSL